MDVLAFLSLFLTANVMNTFLLFFLNITEQLTFTFEKPLVMFIIQSYQGAMVVSYPQRNGIAIKLVS